MYDWVHTLCKATKSLLVAFGLMVVWFTVIIASFVVLSIGFTAAMCLL